MTLYIGVDESIVENPSASKIVIYVASFVKYNSLECVVNDGKKKFSKGKAARASLNLNGLDGFLFATFGLEKPKEETIGFKRKQTEVIYRLLDYILKTSQDLQLLSEGELIEIKIDGSDTFNIKGDLVRFLSDLGYGQDRANIRFIPKGDTIDGVVNYSDLIAYNLRWIKPSDSDIQFGDLAILEQTRNPRVKKMTPYHIESKRLKAIPLEKRVA